MQSAIDGTHHPDPMFSVLGPGVLDTGGSRQVHVRESLEADAALSDVLRALGFVELEQHHYIVDTINWRTDRHRTPVNGGGLTNVRRSSD